MKRVLLTFILFCCIVLSNFGQENAKNTAAAPDASVSSNSETGTPAQSTDFSAEDTLPLQKAESTYKNEGFSESEKPSLGSPLIIFGTEIGKLYSSLGKSSPDERVMLITKRIDKISRMPNFSTELFSTRLAEATTDIYYADDIIMSVTAIDAAAAKKSPDLLAQEYITKIGEQITLSRTSAIVIKLRTLRVFFIEHKQTLIRAALVFAAFIVYILLNVFLSKIFFKLYTLVEDQKEKKFKSVFIKGHELISNAVLARFIVLILKAVKLVITVILLYLLILVWFYFFPLAQYTSIMAITKGIVFSLLTIIVGIGLYKTKQIGLLALKDSVINWKGTLIRPIKIKTISILTEDQIVEGIRKFITIINILLNLLILYIGISIIFSFFEFTNTWASILFNYILTPLKTMFAAFLHFLPNLFFIAIIIFINRYVIKLTKMFFSAIEDGSISIPNFHKDWADPTFKIARGLIIIFALIVIFPYLPGSQSEAFKGVSIFLGILFSLGSTSVIANVVAGTILTYMHAFTIGDKVKIENTQGEVIEKTLLVTRIKTIQNIIITIPNSIVMSSHIVNYTSSSKDGEGLILCLPVNLTYAIPWRKAHELLIHAASITENVKENPPPFVLQTHLDDSYISYELNCYTDKPGKMVSIYSNLRENIQDSFSQAGLEIMTPSYTAFRDGEASTIPHEYKASYVPPPRAVKIVEALSKKKKE